MMKTLRALTHPSTLLRTLSKTKFSIDNNYHFVISSKNGGNSMQQTIPAVFEDGTFRPLKKVSLKEHQIFLLKIDLPKEEHESLLETVEILSNKKQLNRIQTALNNIKKKKIFTHKDIFGHLQPNL